MNSPIRSIACCGSGNSGASPSQVLETPYLEVQQLTGPYHLDGEKSADQAGCKALSAKLGTFQSTSTIPIIPTAKNENRI